MLYLDTSGLVKLVVAESSTDALRAYLREHAAMTTFSSMLAHAELLRAVQHAGEGAASAARRVLAGLHLVDVTREILERAGTLQAPSRLRTLDAIHLATASAVHDRLAAVVTYDARMASAAEALGIAVAAP